jgi:1,4-alpha-glucan branching enzyme
MKRIAIAVILPVLLMAFNYDDGKLTTVYYNSLKFLKQADGPQNLKMIRTGSGSGQSTLCQEGTLFTYRSRGARSVQIAGSFNDWKPVRMERSDSGIWYHFLPATTAKSDVTYKYLVDGIWTPDPLNYDRRDDRMGSYLSVAEPVVKPEGKQVSWRKTVQGAIEFRIYKPKASFISLVGDFNNWNPEDDILAKGQDGIWRLRKKLFPGLYRYQYVVDGDWLPDTYNIRSGSDTTGAVCSIIEIKK